jgi:hypothetical protein
MKLKDIKSKKKSPAEDLEWALSSIENGKLVPIPSFGGPTYVPKNHPAVEIYTKCTYPKLGTPEWNEAEALRSEIITKNQNT